MRWLSANESDRFEFGNLNFRNLEQIWESEIQIHQNIQIMRMQFLSQNIGNTFYLLQKKSEMQIHHNILSQNIGNVLISRKHVLTLLISILDDMFS